MSLNHFSPDFADTLGWARPAITTTNKRLSNPRHHQQNQNEQQQQQHNESPYCIERESMFEKHLTPSDVGKLNRLVIPKQHAEKYFPLNNTTIVNSVRFGSIGDGGVNSVDKGLLLSFDDEDGKCWRFRYSYWNSSQSYVLTKGWSRYVKEKRLDAGDVVFFERDRVEIDRFFIGWRRRSSSNTATAAIAPTTQDISGLSIGIGGDIGGVGWNRAVIYSERQHEHEHQHHQPYPAQPFPYQPECLHAGSLTVQSKAATPIVNSKRLRLFGVNLECQVEEEAFEEPPTPDESSTSSQGQHGHQYHPNNLFYYLESPTTNGTPSVPL